MGSGFITSSQGWKSYTLLGWGVCSPLLLLARGASTLPIHSLCWPGVGGAFPCFLSGSFLPCWASSSPLLGLERKQALLGFCVCSQGHIWVAGFFDSESGIYKMNTNLRELTTASFLVSPARLPFLHLSESYVCFTDNSQGFQLYFSRKNREKCTHLKSGSLACMFLQNSRCQGSGSLESFIR